MSSIFQGNFSSEIQENHVFICENKIAEALGICSTTYLSFSEIYNKLGDYVLDLIPSLPKKVQQGYTILDLFKTQGTIIDDQGNETTTQYPLGFYDYYNHRTKSWVAKDVTIDDAINLIKFYENVKRGVIILDPELDVNKYQEEIDIKNINNSVQKGIRFIVPASSIAWLSVDVDDAEVIVITLHFKSAAKASNKRSVANKGPLMMVDVPRSVTGKTFGFKQTRNFQSEQAANIANYFPPQPGGVDNVENVVAGQLETVYNQNTGRFEAGNRVVLAKVINKQIPPANVDKTPIQDSKSYTAGDFYDPLGGNFNGQYSEGEAVILTCECSNPAMLGPNFVDCKSGEKLEKVKVINRTNNTYEIGETVKLTSIDGFWCAEPYSGETRPKAPLFGEWSFTKLIANSDVYFKDDVFYNNGDKSASVKDYETQARNKFYYNQAYNAINNNFSLWIINQLRLNGKYSVENGLENSTFTPANKYYISTIYDQLSVGAGGWSNVSVIGRTNMALAERGTDVFFDQDCPFFWGPLFSNGYSSFTFNDKAQASGYINGSGSAIEIRDPVSTLQEGDSLQNHLPAEMVGKILDFRNIIYNYDQLGLVPVSGNLNNEYHEPTFYGSVPIGLNRIQFVPMTFEFAAHNDLWAKTEYLRDNVNSARKVYEDIDKYFQDLYNIDPSSRSRSGYFGNMFNRVGNDRLKYIPQMPSQNNPSCSTTYKDTTLNTGPANTNTIMYDCFIRREPTNVPIGAPDYFNDTGNYLGANCVGVISAYNKITKQGGGDINFSVSHVNIGLPSNKQANNSSGFAAFFDGMNLNFLNTGSASRNTERAMWGSTSDNIDSFGTTALHVRIFDSWPEEQTVFDPRYFGVLHFNPGILNSTDGESPVDMETINLAVGTKVFRDTQVPVFKNTIRRGQLLSGGGFKYKHITMGISPSANARIPEGNNKGTKFASGDFIQCGQEDEGGNPTVEILITSVDDNGGILTVSVVKSGFGYSQDLFAIPDEEDKTPIIPIILKSPREGGTSATVWFDELIVVEKERVDEPPKEHTAGPTRLTYPSNGSSYINKTKETIINVSSNSTGQYDCYFHFHNDITHTAMLEHGASQVVGFGQYLDMTIT